MPSKPLPGEKNPANSGGRPAAPPESRGSGWSPSGESDDLDLIILAILALFMGGMILAAKVPPHEDEAEGENRAVSRRLELIRRYLPVPLTLKTTAAGLLPARPLTTTQSIAVWLPGRPHTTPRASGKEIAEHREWVLPSFKRKIQLALSIASQLACTPFDGGNPQHNAAAQDPNHSIRRVHAADPPWLRQPPRPQPKSGTSGDCPRNCTSRCANSCPPCGLAGDLFASRRPWSSLPSYPQAFIDIALYGFRCHLLEMLIGRQNWAFAAAQARQQKTIAEHIANRKRLLVIF